MYNTVGHEQLPNIHTFVPFQLRVWGWKSSSTQERRLVLNLQGTHLKWFLSRSLIGGCLVPREPGWTFYRICLPCGSFMVVWLWQMLRRISVILTNQGQRFLFRLYSSQSIGSLVNTGTSTPPQEAFKVFAFTFFNACALWSYRSSYSDRFLFCWLCPLVLRQVSHCPISESHRKFSSRFWYSVHLRSDPYTCLL